MDRQPIFCPECNKRDDWKIEVERKGKKRVVVTITCKCGYSMQYEGVGESVM
jgi:RNase P subunit RPR2